MMLSPRMGRPLIPTQLIKQGEGGLNKKKFLLYIGYSSLTFSLADLTMLYFVNTVANLKVS